MSGFGLWDLVSALSAYPVCTTWSLHPTMRRACYVIIKERLFGIGYCHPPYFYYTTPRRCLSSIDRSTGFDTYRQDANDRLDSPRAGRRQGERLFRDLRGLLHRPLFYYNTSKGAPSRGTLVRERLVPYINTRNLDLGRSPLPNNTLPKQSLITLYIGNQHITINFNRIYIIYYIRETMVNRINGQWVNRIKLYTDTSSIWLL